MTFTPSPSRSDGPQALARLLAQLGDDVDSAAKEYNALREKLADFFQWRGTAFPEALADETLDRVAQKLQEGRAITNFKGFVYGVARNVALEAERQRARTQSALAEFTLLAASQAAPDDTEGQLGCLRRCLSALPSEARSLIVRYYQTEGPSSVQSRRALAKRLALSYDNLKMRAYRIRLELEACLKRCLAEDAVTEREPASSLGRGRTEA
jgi:DNA-directed RNA polymerase specialized sigma24 family protein